MKLIRKICFFCLTIGITVCEAGYGDLQDSLPTQREREVLFATNAVRMDPIGFRDTYIGTAATILLPENYPAVGPVWYNHDLNRAAHFHSSEMASTCGMTHNSCDGTSFSARVRSYYKASSSIAENVASGVSSGIGTVIQWLRDDNSQRVPAADNSGADGHRKNIMNKQYNEIGTGYSYSSSRQYYHFWTQDFGGGTGAGYKIPAGSHFIAPNRTSILSFGANYFDLSGKPPVKAAVVIDNKEFLLSLSLGKAAAGTYIYSMNNDSKPHCYYFIFIDASGTQIRYPQTTTLSTGETGSCSGATFRKDKLIINQDLKSVSGCYTLINGSLVRLDSENKHSGNLLIYIRNDGMYQKVLRLTR